MKVRFLLFSLFLSFSFCTLIYAQKVFYKSGSGDNWFMHFGVGAQMCMGESDQEANFKDRLSVMPTLSVGKWISPYVGIQLKGQGGSLHGYENEGRFRQKDKYYNLQLDALWDLTSQLGGYSASRIFHVSPYAGLGFAHRFQLAEGEIIPEVVGVQSNYKDCANALSVNGGVKMGFNLSNRISLDIDLGASIVPDYFNRIVRGSEYETVLFATGGITYKLGNVGFDPVEPMDPALIGELNNKVNLLRKSNEKLSAQLAERPETCPDCPPVAPEIPVMTEINYLPNVVFFRINSSEVDTEQQVSVFNTAEFVKENGGKVKVVGYADKDTGSQLFNLKLSEKRAKAVAHELISTYNVSSQNISIEWRGTDEQPYKVNNWNRVVVMTPCK